MSEIQRKLDEIIKKYSENNQDDSYFVKSLFSVIKLVSVSLMEVISEI